MFYFFVCLLTNSGGLDKESINKSMTKIEYFSSSRKNQSAVFETYQTIKQ